MLDLQAMIDALPDQPLSEVMEEIVKAKLEAPRAIPEKAGKWYVLGTGDSIGWNYQPVFVSWSVASPHRHHKRSDRGMVLITLADLRSKLESVAIFDEWLEDMDAARPGLFDRLQREHPDAFEGVYERGYSRMASSEAATIRQRIEGYIKLTEGMRDDGWRPPGTRREGKIVAYRDVLALLNEMEGR